MDTKSIAPKSRDAVHSSAAQARRHLSYAVRGWFAATALGQLLFIAFILLFYYASILSGNMAGWNEKPIVTGYVAGDEVGNSLFAVHVVAAALMTFAGLIQLVPQIRARWPRIHRWSGRIFLTFALLLSVGGLWLTWVRESYLTVTGAVAITLDALLIIWFGTMAWRTAMQRNFAAHRRWALRTFIVASGVWFMRIGYMVWGITTGGAGIERGMSGPFDLFWAFATHLLPLLILEIYFVAERGRSAVQHVMAGVLWLGAVLILLGSGGAWMIMWSPHI